jgi:hypothetical protein
MRKNVAELADKVKMVAIKALTMNVLVRQLADKGVIWRSSNDVRSEVARENAAPLAPLAKNAGNNDGFEGAHAALLAPLANFAGRRRNARTLGTRREWEAGRRQMLTVLKVLEAIIPDPYPGVPGRRELEQSSEKGMCAEKQKRWTSGEFLGVFACFSRGPRRASGPSREFLRVFDGFRRSERSQWLIPWQKIGGRWK